MRSPVGKALTAFLIMALAVLTALLAKYAATLGVDVGILVSH
jgi:hypothetical protein